MLLRHKFLEDGLRDDEKEDGGYEEGELREIAQGACGHLHFVRNGQRESTAAVNLHLGHALIALTHRDRLGGDQRLRISLRMGPGEGVRRYR